jgi:hypothetical protein
MTSFDKNRKKLGTNLQEPTTLDTFTVSHADGTKSTLVAQLVDQRWFMHVLVTEASFFSFTILTVERIEFIRGS